MRSVAMSFGTHMIAYIFAISMKKTSFVSRCLSSYVWAGGETKEHGVQNRGRNHLHTFHTPWAMVNPFPSTGTTCGSSADSLLNP